MIDLSLYVILGPIAGQMSLAEMAVLAARGGASFFQLRDKDADAQTLIAATAEIRRALASFKRPLVLNDDAALAARAGADGVHVGQSDDAPAKARDILGPEKIIGLSIRTMDEAENAPLDLLDYAAIGGVFETSSKRLDNPPIGVSGLAAIAALLRRRRPGLPLVAISGMNAARAPEVIRAGADGVAVISAVTEAADITAAANKIAGAVAGAKAGGAGS